MPSWLVWLSPIPMVTLAAVAWTTLAGRRRGAIRATESVQAYEKFRTAMQAPRDR